VLITEHNEHKIFTDDYACSDFETITILRLMSTYLILLNVFAVVSTGRGIWVGRGLKANCLQVEPWELYTLPKIDLVREEIFTILYSHTIYIVTARSKWGEGDRR